METLADKLHRMLEDENSSRQIIKIPLDAYKQIASHIKSIRSESIDKDRNLISELSLAERKILYDIAKRLIEIRIEKFRHDSDLDVANLTPEERFIAEPLAQSKKRLDRVAESILNGQVGELEHAARAVKQKYVYVRFAQPYSAVTGTDLAVYGPFEPEDVAIVPIENAKLLLKNGIIMKNWIEPEER
jgi:DNA replication initiation complex subunit (GINS family)